MDPPSVYETILLARQSCNNEPGSNYSSPDRIPSRDKIGGAMVLVLTADLFFIKAISAEVEGSAGRSYDRGLRKWQQPRGVNERSEKQGILLQCHWFRMTKVSPDIGPQGSFSKGD